MSGLASEVPVLDYSRNLVSPRHRHGISGDIHNHKFRSHGGKSLNHSVLRIWQFIAFPVGAFRILMVTLVQTTDEYHIVSVFGGTHRISDQFFRRTALAKILSRSHAIVLTTDVSDIATFIDHFGIREPFFDALQRRDLVLNFK